MTNRSAPAATGAASGGDRLAAQSSTDAPDEWKRTVAEALRRRDGTSGNGDELTIRCIEPGHEDSNPSATWNVRKGAGGCFGCKATWSTKQAAKLLGVHLPERSTGGEMSWPIRDVNGETVAVHHRVNELDGSKQVWWSRDGSPRLDGMRVAALPLYGCERLADRADDPVVVVEGEKAADAARERHGLLAVGTVTGSSGTPSDESLAVLSGRAVLLWPDADEPGRDHMRRIAERINGVAASVHLVDAEALELEDGSGDDAADLDNLPDELPTLGIEEWLVRTGRDEAQAVKTKRRAVVECFADVEPEDVGFLWEPYVPLGKLTILEGDPGLGKTWLALNLAAVVSNGWSLPQDDRKREPSAVLYLSAEDGLADTLRPRLDTAGADVSKVFALTEWRETSEDGEQTSGPITLKDLPLIEAKVKRLRPRLVVIDPIQGYLGAGVDMHRANEVRPLLTALGKMAEHHGCAVVVVRHLRKSQASRAVHRGLGSIDFSAAARSILLVGDDPDANDDQSGERILAHVKCSIAPLGQSLEFKLSEGRFLWGGASGLTADDLLAAPQSPEERSAIADGERYLQNELADGPKPVKDLQAGAPCSRRTLRRAKAKVGAESLKTDFDSGWCWHIPPKKVTEVAKASKDTFRTPSTPSADLSAGINGYSEDVQPANGRESWTPSDDEVVL